MFEIFRNIGREKAREVGSLKNDPSPTSEIHSPEKKREVRFQDLFALDLVSRVLERS